MKKSLIATTLCAVAVFGLGCGANQTAVQTNSSTSSTTTNSSTSSTTGTVQEFTITADQFSYSPSSITVKTGDTVKLHLTSSDVTHGFSLPQFGVNATMQPGKTVDKEFVADKAGTYTFSCSVACGSGHAAMRGTVVVQ
jgi:cytochrome c oxidase subunit 2